MFGSRSSHEYTVQRPFSWLKKAVLVIAIVAFISLIWYAAANRDSIHNENLTPELVEAPKFALKERPEMPGGMEIPHQDKEVFDLLAVTEPRKPDLAAAFEAAEKAEKAVVKAEEDVVTEAQKTAEVAKSALVPTPEVAPTPKDVQEPLKAVAPPVPAPSPLLTNSVTGWGVQLGSFQRTSDAENAIKIFNKKFGSMLEGLKPTIRQVELEKGTFYRVTYVGLENKEAARNLCHAFKQRGQGCLHVNLQ